LAADVGRDVLGSALKVPQELLEFLALPGPQPLLVRGPPGSGKSTLALALLEAFSGEKFLVTTRVPDRELRREFPGLSHAGADAISVVDATQAGGGVREVARAFAGARSQLLAEGTAGGKELGEFLWLPAPIQEIWASVRPDRPMMVVIDSWDALVESYLGGTAEPGRPVPDRAEIERLLLRRMNQAPVHLVLLLESRAETQLDYLMNAVLETDLIAVEGRLERWLWLRKLRGVRIEHFAHPFTLEGGGFSCILPGSSTLAAHAGEPEADPDPRSRSLWPGSRSFADAFGRLAYGTVTLLEVEPDVPVASLGLLLSPITVHVLRKNGRVGIISPPSVPPGAIVNRFRGNVPDELLRDRLRILSASPSRGVPASLRKVTVHPRPETQSVPGPRFPGFYEFLRASETGAVPRYGEVSVDGLRALGHRSGFSYSPDDLPGIVQAYADDPSTHLLIFGRPTDPLVSSLSGLATTHIRVAERHGRTLLMGHHPRTPAFVLVESGESAPYGLLRIV
jgi:KaiC/GvpD/RAD55 family RecA-like ATPase